MLNHPVLDYGTETVDDFLENVDWNFKLAHLNVEQLLIHFVDILILLIDRFIPLNLFHLPFNPCTCGTIFSRKKSRKNLWDYLISVSRTFGRNSNKAWVALRQYLQIYKNASLSNQSNCEA